MAHFAYFTDIFTLDNVTFDFVYTKLDGNRWSVSASLAVGVKVCEFYTATDDRPESLESLIATHRQNVADLVASWADALQPKVKHHD